VGGKESAERTQRMRWGAPVAGTHVEDPERSDGLCPAAMGPEANDAHPRPFARPKPTPRASATARRPSGRPHRQSIVTGTDETRIMRGSADHREVERGRPQGRDGNHFPRAIEAEEANSAMQQDDTRPL
jgi:hypothetical protein